MKSSIFSILPENKNELRREISLGMWGKEGVWCSQWPGYYYSFSETNSSSGRNNGKAANIYSLSTLHQVSFYLVHLLLTKTL